MKDWYQHRSNPAKPGCPVTGPPLSPLPPSTSTMESQ